VVELAIRVVLSLAVVLGLFWMVARTGSRKLGGRDRKLVTVRSRQALSRGSSLAVVEVGSRVLVVGVSDGGIRLLTELDPQELEGREAAPAQEFDQTRYPSLSSPAEAPAETPAKARTKLRTKIRTTSPAPLEEPSFAAVYADEASYLPAQVALPEPVPEPAPEPPSYAPSDEPVHEPSFDDAYDTYEPEPSLHQVPARVPARASGGVGGSLLDGAVWRDAWASATGRSHRGDAA
jgi:flagellar protein FliO/FliZ